MPEDFFSLFFRHFDALFRMCKKPQEKVNYIANFCVFSGQKSYIWQSHCVLKRNEEQKQKTKDEKR